MQKKSGINKLNQKRKERNYIIMKITTIQVTVVDLTENYEDDGDGDVFGYDDRLIIRPSFQREFV